MSLPHPRPEFSPPVGQLIFHGRTWVIYDLRGSYLVCNEDGRQTSSFPLDDLRAVGDSLVEEMTDAER